ncbi:hypothetical protein MASSI9I_90152 [Massilia sp. 9I]|nr:hypothetical protein MASSI9I_90152 [Massilia sp. 9I]
MIFVVTKFSELSILYFWRKHV